MPLRALVACVVVAGAALGSPRGAPHPPPPDVAPGQSGPRRFVGPLYEKFDAERALRDAAFIDGWYRAPGNTGYRATLDHLRKRLAAAGFGDDPRLELRTIESESPQPVWDPRSAELRLIVGEESRLLHAFDGPAGRDRVMLPVHAPSCDVTGPVALALEQLEPGAVLVVDAPLRRDLLQAAADRGALAVLSSRLHPFTVDPTGAERHLDAVLYASVPRPTPLPVGQISPRSHRAIRQAAASGEPVQLAFRAEVEQGEARVATLVAAIVGASRPGEAVAVAGHVQEPGAGDNASGVAGLLEAATSLAGLLREESLPWPARTVVFLWGDEMAQSRRWLDTTSRRPVAGILADMLGQSRERTGAIALLERAPDPGAQQPLPPDRHTSWGAGRVDPERILPAGLALIARTALSDVASHVGGWTFGEHPWEGGSDHDVFLGHGVPAVLLWHFTDFAYHTGLDRMELLDAEELRRTSVAVAATALAVADARPGDLERYRASLKLERELRLEAAAAAGKKETAGQWRRWFRGAGAWLEELCGEP